MKWIGSILLCFFGMVPWAFGQVTVQLQFDQEQFVEDESMPVKVRITNLSGERLHLGEAEDWLTFNISDSAGRIIPKLGPIPVQGAFSMESSRVATRVVDLGPFYDLPPGRFFVTGYLHIKQWNRETASEPTMIEVLRGTKMWEQVVGVPQETGPPEPRLYTLLQADYLKTLTLYVRVTDATDERVFRVFPLGQLVSFGRPEVQIDQKSHLHVLFQTGARSFIYGKVDPQGILTVRRRYDFYGSSRPHLRTNEQDELTVQGGIRRVTRNDIPIPTSFELTNEVSVVTPAP